MLQQCWVWRIINQIQRKEIIQVQREARQLKNRPQNLQVTPANNLDKFHKTSKGYISVDPKEYVKLTDEEKEAIQEYNVKLRETLKQKATDTPSAPDKKQKQLPLEARTYRILPNIPDTLSSSEEVKMDKLDRMSDGMNHPTPLQDVSELSNQFS